MSKDKILQNKAAYKKQAQSNNLPNRPISAQEYIEMTGAEGKTAKQMETIVQKRDEIVKQLADYVKKYKFNKVLLGLSGGMDSALVLALACDALGPENVQTYMMKTKYTSQLSIDLAQEAANLNGTHHEVIDIQPIVDAYTKALAPAKKPVTEQNLQARIRGTIGMWYSNDNFDLLLACGNKSEAAMGYCTLYGDTAGGLMPIGDLYKTEVYDMAELYNREGRYFVPQGIIDRPPSAELAPDQKDTDSLPPYSELDPILRDYVYGNEKVPANMTEQVEKIRGQVARQAFKQDQVPEKIDLSSIENGTATNTNAGNVLLRQVQSNGCRN